MPGDASCLLKVSCIGDVRWFGTQHNIACRCSQPACTLLSHPSTKSGHGIVYNKQEYISRAINDPKRAEHGYKALH